MKQEYQKPPRNQAFSQRNLRKPTQRLSLQVQSDPQATLLSLPLRVRELLDLLIWYRSKHNIVYPSQGRLAEHMGVSRRHVRRLLNRLVELGLIGKWYRHMRSCYYNISRFFFDEYIKSSLKHILPSLTLLSFSLVMLLSIVGVPQSAHKYGIMYHHVLQRYYNVFNIAKKGDGMEIPSYIRDIKSINLTNAGKIQLLALTAEGIKAADKKIQSYRNKEVSNLFRLFYSIAAAEGGDQDANIVDDRLHLVTDALKAGNVAPDAALLENVQINNVSSSEFSTKGKHKTKGAAAWQPISDDPYYRSPAQRDIFERQRNNRDAEWSKLEPEESSRIDDRAMQLRKSLGLNEQGERVRPPSPALLATPFKNLYHAAKNAKRFSATEKVVRESMPEENTQPMGYTHDAPYINEESPWVEV